MQENEKENEEEKETWTFPSCVSGVTKSFVTPLNYKSYKNIYDLFYDLRIAVITEKCKCYPENLAVVQLNIRNVHTYLLTYISAHMQLVLSFKRGNARRIDSREMSGRNALGNYPWGNVRMTSSLIQSKRINSGKDYKNL